VSTEVFSLSFSNKETQILHLMVPGTNDCVICGASKFAMRTYFTKVPQVWINARTFGKPFPLVDQDEIVNFLVCKADKKEVYDDPDYAPLHPGSAE
jgi:hypothetical protein